jgi:antitoxin MazE
MQVSKWGNSLAVRLPKAVVEALDLKEGDSLDIQVAGTRAVDVTRTPDTKALLARETIPGIFPPVSADRLEARARLALSSIPTSLSPSRPTLRSSPFRGTPGGGQSASV